jgi:hypothetical protein
MATSGAACFHKSVGLLGHNSMGMASHANQTFLLGGELRLLATIPGSPCGRELTICKICSAG